MEVHEGVGAVAKSAFLTDQAVAHRLAPVPSLSYDLDVDDQKNGG
jgi:hypothetical protein